MNLTEKVKKAFFFFFKNIHEGFEIEKYIETQKKENPETWVKDGEQITTPEGKPVLTYIPYLTIEGYCEWFFQRYPSGRIVAVEDIPGRENPRFVGENVKYGVELYDGETLLSRGYGIEKSLPLAKAAAIRFAMADANMRGLNFSALREAMPKFVAEGGNFVPYEGETTTLSQLFKKEDTQVPGQIGLEEVLEAVKELDAPSEAEGPKTISDVIEELHTEASKIIEKVEAEEAEEVEEAPVDEEVEDASVEEVAEKEVKEEQASPEEVIFRLLPGVTRDLPGLGSPMKDVPKEVIKMFLSPAYRSKAGDIFPPEVIEAAKTLAERG